MLIAPGIVPLLWMPLNIFWSGGRNADVGGALLIAVLCYFGAIAAGLPALRLMRHRGLMRWNHFLVGGALAGLVFSLLWLAFGLPFMAIMLLIGTLTGVTSALAFWFIAIKPVA